MKLIISFFSLILFSVAHLQACVTYNPTKGNVLKKRDVYKVVGKKQKACAKAQAFFQI